MTTIKEFAELLEHDQIEWLHKSNLACEENINNAKTTVKRGKKYTKVDVGGSGKYMISQERNIFGIKAYGVIHKGHCYGTLDTIHNYNWGGYTAAKK